MTNSDRQGRGEVLSVSTSHNIFPEIAALHQAPALYIKRNKVHSITKDTTLRFSQIHGSCVRWWSPPLPADCREGRLFLASSSALPKCTSPMTTFSHAQKIVVGESLPTTVGGLAFTQNFPEPGLSDLLYRKRVATVAGNRLHIITINA